MRSPWAQLLSLVALATPFSRPATTSAAEMPTFAALVIGESAEIAYRSVGPKGTVERTLVVAPESWGFQVTPRSDGGGTLMLAEKDVEGLDRLLALYRSPRTGTCERRDGIGIVWKRAGARIADESFVDLSCSRANVRRAAAHACRRHGLPDPPSRLHLGEAVQHRREDAGCRRVRH